MKEYEFHEAANIFPLDEEHLDELAEDIRQHKQQVAIELFNGTILDGRRRYLACKKVGIAPRVIEVDVLDPVQYVLSLNLHRRHLSPTQLAMVGARARGIYDAQAKERQERGGDIGRQKQKGLMVNLPQAALDAGAARDHAARAVGVSGTSIEFGTKVLKDGTPALQAAVDKDLIAVSTAAKATRLSPSEQDLMAERATKAAAEGHRRRPRPTVTNGIQEGTKPEGELRGVGVFRANEAIDCLRRIPKNDGLRKRGFQIVMDWIRDNK